MLDSIRKLEKRILKEVSNDYKRYLHKTIDFNSQMIGIVGIVISQSNPFELNITKIAANIEVSRNTIYAYLNHLDRGGLLNIVASNKRGISRLSKPEKFLSRDRYR